MTWGDEGAVMASKEGGGRGRKANEEVRQGFFLLIYISWKQYISLAFIFSTTSRSFCLRYYDVVGGARADTVVVLRGGGGRNGIERGKRVRLQFKFGVGGVDRKGFLLVIYIGWKQNSFQSCGAFDLGTESKFS